MRKLQNDLVNSVKMILDLLLRFSLHRIMYFHYSCSFINIITLSGVTIYGKNIEGKTFMVREDSGYSW